MDKLENRSEEHTSELQSHVPALGELYVLRFRQAIFLS